MLDQYMLEHVAANRVNDGTMSFLVNNMHHAALLLIAFRPFAV